MRDVCCTSRLCHPLPNSPHSTPHPASALLLLRGLFHEVEKLFAGVDIEFLVHVSDMRLRRAVCDA